MSTSVPAADGGQLSEGAAVSARQSVGRGAAREPVGRTGAALGVHGANVRTSQHEDQNVPLTGHQTTMVKTMTYTPADTHQFAQFDHFDFSLVE